MNVSVKQLAEGLEFEATFSAGNLALDCQAIVDKTHRIKTGSERMSSNNGVLFKRQLSSAAGQIVLRYDFGTTVQGVSSLLLIGERARSATYVYGQADGKDILPIRFPEPVCGCGNSDATVLKSLGGGKTEVVSIMFPDDFATNLQKLIPVIKAAIQTERFAFENLITFAWAGCFWGTLACELGAKACILGCAGNPICIVACLAAEVACLLAVDESKAA